jgi:cytochrome c biogenesis protein CcmG/thiol:disulfide interchange protein DsbE
MTKLPVLALGILFVTTVGAGSAPAEDNTPAPKVVDARDDMAKAEARNAASHRTTPAVDTSQLKAAPEWTLADLQGKPVKSSDLIGKVVLVDFWATWCGPCRRSIPHLIELHERYKDQGLEVVGVSLDQKGPSVVIPFVEQNNISYSVLMGNQKVVQDFGGVRGIPTAFIISQDGKIFRKLVGLVPKERYEADIKALLGVS